MTLASAAIVSALLLFAVGIENATMRETRNLDGPLHHVQGLDLDGQHFWITSVDGANHKGYLNQFNRATAKFERVVSTVNVRLN